MLQRHWYTRWTGKWASVDCCTVAVTVIWCHCEWVDVPDEPASEHPLTVAPLLSLSSGVIVSELMCPMNWQVSVRWPLLSLSSGVIVSELMCPMNWRVSVRWPLLSLSSVDCCDVAVIVIWCHCERWLRRLLIEWCILCVILGNISTYLLYQFIFWNTAG